MNTTVIFVLLILLVSTSVLIYCLVKKHETHECPDNCSKQGKCDTKTGKCKCNTGFAGDNCSKCDTDSGWFGEHCKNQFRKLKTGSGGGDHGDGWSNCNPNCCCGSGRYFALCPRKGNKGVDCSKPENSKKCRAWCLKEDTLKATSKNPDWMNGCVPGYLPDKGCPKN